MKARNGFVSNSSSSSFIVEMNRLGFSKLHHFEKNKIEDMIHEVRDLFKNCHTEYETYGWPSYGAWDIEIYKDYFLATTTLDNFDLIQYMDDKFGIRNQNLTVFGSYTGFHHSLKELENFVDMFLIPKKISDNKELVIDVGKEFNHRLIYATQTQNCGPNNGESFRKRFLSHLDNPTAWKTEGNEIILDFRNVTTMGPGFAANAFAYFRQYASKDDVLKKIQFINITRVQKEIIEMELDEEW